MMGDFDIALPGGFTLSRESEDNVEIVDFANGTRSGVAAKVIEIAWNERFFFAKRQALKPRGDFPGDNLPVPDSGKYDYWILDTVQTNRIGPLTETDFYRKAASLGMDKIKLKDVEKLRKR